MRKSEPRLSVGEGGAAEIQPGMSVEATAADLGEQDLTRPVVSDVVYGDGSQVEKIVVKKGTVFTKEIEVPVDRIAAVEQHTEGDGRGANGGKVFIQAGEEEIEALASVGTTEGLGPLGGTQDRDSDNKRDKQDVLEQTEEALPTEAGLRRLEEQADAAAHGPPQAAQEDKQGLLRVLGPGFLSGMAGNDSSAVTAYAVDGAVVGYSHLWLMLLATPLLHAVQFTCAKVGRIAQKGMAEILREHYGLRVAVPAALLLLLANTALITADLVAIGSGLELLTGVSWKWFVLPVAGAIWYITVYRSFDAIKKIFLVLSLAFVAYIVTGLLSGADWGQVLSNTVVPRIDFSFASISAAVALLGATISPYSMFWQVQGEKEEQRAGPIDKKLRLAAIDIASGVISGNLVAYFIMVSTAATLFTNHRQITTAADAARSLEPLLGPFAAYLFALGLIGSGLVAVPILLASTSYAVAGTIGWPTGLSKKPWQNEGFYLILTFALVVSLAVAVLGFDPIQLMFRANVLQGVLAPPLVVLLLLVANNRRVMGVQRVGRVTGTALVLVALLMCTAVGLLFYGLATGQG